MIERFLNDLVTEYAADTTKDPTGRVLRTYRRLKVHRARLEPMTAEVTQRAYGLEERVEFRMFTTSRPTVGNFVKLGDEHFLISKVLPQKGLQGVHHYVSLLSRQ